MGSILKNSGIFDMISSIANPVNQQPTGITSIPVINQNPKVNMTGGRFNQVRDPRLNRVASRPMFRTPQMSGRVNYQNGGSSNTSPKFLPMDPESVGFRLFGKNIDNLTYIEKQAVRDYIDDNKLKKAKGGRIGYEGGGPISLGMELYLIAKKTFEEQGYNPKEAHEKALEASGIKSVVKEYGPGVKKAKGGIMNLKMGGMPVEMDLRAKGGFVPIGKRERADDVPARLSKNEFVFTANAVRNAGGGDIRKGAKRMYDLMNKLEVKR